MQILSFTKENAGSQVPSVLLIEPGKEEELVRAVSRNGTLCLIPESSWQRLSAGFSDAGYLNCGIKQAKVELFRSLRFHEKKDLHLPRRLIFLTVDRGALKRSLDKFYKDRFSASDPACLIIISDDNLAALIEDYEKAEKKKRLKMRTGDDPMGELLQETETNPVILQVGKAYLGTSYDMRMVRLLILKASQSKSPVLILGESGTGKDVIARQIAKFSRHYSRSFATVNCAALPETLLEGELFGYMKSSFTGALTDKTGLLAAHNGGTVFLDEIGDLSLANQAKLLLALDSKLIRPVGSNDNIEVDVRIIAATNRNIDHMSMYGRFREDLLHRLNVMRIYAPPLRSHPGDIPAIADHIWHKLNPGGRLSPLFHRHLMSYPWPGNVRELKSLLTSILDIFGEGSPTPAHIESIRRARHDNLVSTINNPADDKTQLLKLEAKLRLTSLQNILRGIKVAMRPVINMELTPDNYSGESEKIRQHIAREVGMIENLCREPLYFKDYGLFKETTRYRYLLEKMLRRWPASSEKLLEGWNAELNKLDDDITLGIMELVWGKIDM